MNPKVAKFKEEKERNEARIERLKARNRYIDQRVEELDNTDIIGLVRARNLSPDQLAELLEMLDGPSAAREPETTTPRRTTAYEN